MTTSNKEWAIFIRSRVLKKEKLISYHIYSSLRSNMKNEVSNARANSSWLIGDGTNVNFWNDPWCGEPISNQLHLNQQLSMHLTAKVCDFINDGHWEVPAFLQVYFPILASLVTQVTLPSQQVSDRLLWKHSNNGELSLKEPYIFKASHSNHVKWAKAIWSPDIPLPPPRSIVSWRLMHRKTPTDYQLSLRGISLASMCSCCSKAQETSLHLFFPLQFCY